MYVWRCQCTKTNDVNQNTLNWHCQSSLNTNLTSINFPLFLKKKKKIFLQDVFTYLGSDFWSYILHKRQNLQFNKWERVLHPEVSRGKYFHLLPGGWIYPQGTTWGQTETIQIVLCKGVVIKFTFLKILLFLLRESKNTSM